MLATAIHAAGTAVATHVLHMHDHREAEDLTEAISWINYCRYIKQQLTLTFLYFQRSLSVVLFFNFAYLARL